MERHWLQNFEMLKNQVKSRRQQGTTVPSAEIKGYSAKLSELTSQLKTIAASPMEYEICPSEITRRQALVENFTKQLSALDMTGKSISGSNGTPSTMNPLQLNDASLLTRQKEVIAMQDEMVVDLGKGVDRLHKQAVVIGDEAKQQTVLLSNIDSRVEVATEGLKEEASHAKLVASKAASCYLYICVAVEVVIIVILIILMAMK